MVNATFAERERVAAADLRRGRKPNPECETSDESRPKELITEFLQKFESGSWKVGCRRWIPEN